MRQKRAPAATAGVLSNGSLDGGTVRGSDEGGTMDQAKVEQFVGRAMGDLSAVMNVFMASIGDRLGLFRALAADGPATSEALAQRTGLQERYVREWLGQMASAGYLEYAPARQTFTLPPEHAPVLAVEGGPMFMGGAYQMTPLMALVFDKLVHAFQHGGGVPQSAYPAAYYEGMDRFSAGWFEHQLLQSWIPAVPEVMARLESGIDVADVGCGSGRALVKLAQRFLRSRFVGYDLFAPNVEKATALARQAGVADRVRFEARDVSRGLPARFDLITTFDVVHDAADPLALMRGIKQALTPSGAYLCLEMACSDKLEENAGPMGAMLHGVSVMYCMTTSLAQGGAGLGALGVHEPKLNELAREAGFGFVRKLPIENPFNYLYELR